MLSLFLSLWLSIAIAQALPPAPPDVTQVALYSGKCGEREVFIKKYESSAGDTHFRYLYNGKVFAVFIPPLAFVKRADGRVEIFNPVETGETVCEVLEKALDKAI